MTTCPAELSDLERQMKELLDFWRDRATEDQYVDCIEQSIEVMNQVAAAPVRSLEDVAAAIRIILLRGTHDPDDRVDAPIESCGSEEMLVFANSLRSVRDFLEAYGQA